MGMAVAKKTIDRVEDLTGRQKVAVLLMALGDEGSKGLTKHLSPDEVEGISFEIARMGKVEPYVVEAVLDEWHNTERAAFSLARGGVDSSRRVLEQAFGPKEAAKVMKKIEAQLNDHISLQTFKSADPAQLSAVIRGEHPQIISVLLAFLGPDHTSAVLGGFDTQLSGEILLRMARMDSIHPDALKVIEASLGAESDLVSGVESSSAGGHKAVAEILNRTSPELSKELMDSLGNGDPELAQRVKDLMFVFEDMIKLDDTAITRVLRDVETKELALALKVASEELQEKLFGTLSSRARDALQEEIEFLGPVRVSEVEKAQASVVKTVRALDEAGEISIGTSDDEVVK
jgi:flagellar motor switch protein FliG